MGKLKVVIKLDLKDDKTGSKALKTAVGQPGVTSAAIEGEQKDKLVVTGDGIDSVALTQELRKRTCIAELISVGPVIDKEEEKKMIKQESKKKDPKQESKAFSTHRLVLQWLTDVFGLTEEISKALQQGGQFEDTAEMRQLSSRVDELIVSHSMPQPGSQVDESILKLRSLQGDELTVYGRKDDMTNVIGLLLSDDCRDHQVSVIQVVGAGGVGKTTLLQCVYHNASVSEIFDTRAWVTVWEKIDARGLTKAIVESLAGISCGLTELSELEETLREELMGKKFLLVLYDVNSMDQSLWSSLLTTLNVGAKGSIVMVTARNEIDTNMRRIMCSYYLERLSEENCRLILQQCAFDRFHPSAYPKLKEIGKQIITKCKGNPLAVKALGGLLSSTTNSVSLNAVLTSELWLQDSSEALPALRLSFDHLPTHLKCCFQYCSLFPKGYVFGKDQLVRLWMSQGFIEPKGDRLEDIGIEYFDELLRRSFFQYSPNNDFTKRKYVIPNLFHDLAQALSVAEHLRVEDCKLISIPENLHHASLVPYELKSIIHFELPKEAGDIRTFLFINRSTLKWAGDRFHFENPDVLTNLFLQFSGLRTLDLSFTNIKVLPDSVGNLVNLCYLGLNYTNIRRLPESICNLYRLQSLELRGCGNLCELPKDAKKLTNLRHLDIQKESGFVNMPKGIGELSNLQTLSTFNVSGDGWHCAIEELKSLVNLRGGLAIAGLENVINWEDAEEANLKNKRFLQTLTLQWFNNFDDLEGNESARTCFEVLQSLQPHDSLEELIIRNYFGDHFPNWMGRPSFFKLISITLDNCCECNILPPLGQLRNLKHLSIRKMDSVRSIGHEFCGSDTMIMSGFPSLETLKLWEMSDLEEWCGVEDEDFPYLRSLSISRCPRLRRLPRFTSLEELSVHGCIELPDLPTLPSLKSLIITGFQSLISLLLPVNLPALTMLEISHCNQLSRVRGLGQLDSVEKLKLVKCLELHYSYFEPFPSMLQVVDIHGCPQLSEWCPENFKQIADANQASRKLIKKNSEGNFLRFQPRSSNFKSWL